ncbi:hypothetical protein J7T55_010411 [Diaporthe amygdali]|uniref:uncharacterized protein n=1 Tax=Phomopsis amygdali TaxID=1214568 RepID=UPI0022FEAB56|nr:uncharacterized protein J7T55_010411 [Diaporthe amygdali]KAJ0115588.1 hypothetical protein J7T55_010411 [Diaporthe amygdali]
MSGLEPLAALGLACNILQIVELGQKTIACIKDVYQGRTPDEELKNNAVGLESLANEIKKHSGPGKKKLEEILVQSAASCSKAARELREEMHFLFDNAKRGSLASALKVTAKVAWRKRRLDRLQGNLDTEEKRMQNRLLAQIWSSTDAAHIKLDGARRELRFFIEQYREGRRETTDLVSSEGLKTREQVSLEAGRTNKAVALVGQKMDCLVMSQEAHVDDQIRDRFLKSLKFPDFNQRRNQIDDAYEDTLDWVFVGDHDDYSDEDFDSEDAYGTTESGSGSGSDRSTDADSGASSLEGEEDGDQELLSEIKWDSFSNWLSSTDAIYWISGKPGSGKTTLVKYILGQDRTKKYLNAWSPGCEVASHYFWRPGSTMQRNMEGLFCSLLYQLLGCNNTALRKVISSVSGPKDSYTDWSSSELRSALLKTLDSYENGVCLFLDGIDEINPENKTKDSIPEFLDWAFKLSQRRKIKLCLASRPDPQILETKLSIYPRIRLQDLNYEDLMVYAEEHVEFPETEMSEDQYDPIRSLVAKAEGVFLWLILATKSINEGFRNYDSVESLQKRIDHLPKDLDSLYQDMWARAGADSLPEYGQTAALYFKLLLASRHRQFSTNRFNIFQLMLATTPVADRVLDALDGTSDFVSQDIMLRRCQEVERKVKIYCAGLVESGTEGRVDEAHRDTSSWYGHMYDMVWPIATSSDLQFIHRTARDFLTDTESGRKILDFETASEFTVHYRLMKAWLAKLALFAHNDDSADWSYKLTRFHETWEGTNEWVCADWHRLMLICEKLANSGRLFVGSWDDAIPCPGADFLRVLAQYHWDDEFIISRLKDGNLSGNEKSAILMGLADSVTQLSHGRHGQSRLRTFRELLSAGADPNWQWWESCHHLPATQLETPWQHYLVELMQFLSFIAQHRRWQVANTWTEVAIRAEIVLSFITEGAKLDVMLNICITNEKYACFAWDICTSLTNNLMGTRSYRVYASVPAYTIVRTLTETMRHGSSQFDEGPFPESCVSLEQACMDQRSSTMCRVFGQLNGKEPHPAGRYVLWEITEDMQTQLGSKLVEEGFKWIPWKISAEIGSRSDSHGGHYPKIFQSIINDESWILNPDVTSDRSMRKWLEELGLVKLVDKRPNIRQWVEKHRKETLQSGIAK